MQVKWRFPRWSSILLMIHKSHGVSLCCSSSRWRWQGNGLLPLLFSCVFEKLMQERRKQKENHVNQPQFKKNNWLFGLFCWLWISSTRQQPPKNQSKLLKKTEFMTNLISATKYFNTKYGKLTFHQFKYPRDVIQQSGLETLHTKQVTKRRPIIS